MQDNGAQKMVSHIDGATRVMAYERIKMNAMGRVYRIGLTIEEEMSKSKCTIYRDIG
ncbi:hypothetical protein [Grimontia hollisae]|uniref:hypothetical protein n=1 Tax=Grimontia hollisae TaxID=673 RepID=UPI0018EF136B|nr:hypothetical protein [Grimontia hollisae]